MNEYSFNSCVMGVMLCNTISLHISNGFNSHVSNRFDRSLDLPEIGAENDDGAEYEEDKLGAP